jgi:hypothetical protein
VRVLAIPDRHFPWAHKKACEWVVYLARLIEPHAIVGLGDELDLYSLSRYPKSVNIMTPAEEYQRGMEQYREHWRRIKAESPKSACYEISSNHGDRLRKRIRERAPELEGYLMEQPFGVPGVERITGELELDHVLYMHGFRSKGIDHARYNQRSTVHGHSHSASLRWLRNGKGSYFNLECGWLGAEDKEAFSYNPQALTQWTLACGTVTDGYPTLMKFPRRWR